MSDRAHAKASANQPTWQPGNLPARHSRCVPLTGGVQLGLLIVLYQVVIWSAVAMLPPTPPIRGSAIASACAHEHMHA